jgi:hypothetical protein
MTAPGPKRRKTTSARMPAIGGTSGLLVFGMSFVARDPNRSSVEIARASLDKRLEIGTGRRERLAEEHGSRCLSRHTIGIGHDLAVAGCNTCPENLLICEFTIKHRPPLTAATKSPQ